VTEHSAHVTVGGVEIEFTTGRMAIQADGAVMAKVGGTEVLATAVGSRGLREGVDFFPLTVDVEERMYAVGKIPGSFFRREGRPTERAILTCRLIDRPLRPSFRDGFRSETHIIATVMSVDDANPYDVVALNAASAALTVSPIPFEGPIAGVRMAYSHGEWIPMPTFEQLADSVFDLVVAGKRNSDGDIDIAMVEAGATEEALRLIDAGQAPTDEVAVGRGLDEAKQHIAALIDAQLELRSKVEIPEVEWPSVIDYEDDLLARVEAAARPRLADVITIAVKKDRNAAEDAALGQTLAELGITDDSEDLAQAKKAFKSVAKKVMRERVVHGSGAVPARRDPGAQRHHPGHAAHGADARHALAGGLEALHAPLQLPAVLHGETGHAGPRSAARSATARSPSARCCRWCPAVEDFPYAYRLVSEVLSSNGSTSMASVCASSLSLMDAGVPIKAPVAGIAMGLIFEDGKYVTLTDILGAEDALGDMDFKVAGTADVDHRPAARHEDRGHPGRGAGRRPGPGPHGPPPHPRRDERGDRGAPPEMSPNAPRIEAVRSPRTRSARSSAPRAR
jgi:polyribonucleotide nucleotidyltransferase